MSFPETKEINENRFEIYVPFEKETAVIVCEENKITVRTNMALKFKCERQNMEAQLLFGENEINCKYENFEYSIKVKGKTDKQGIVCPLEGVIEFTV